MLREVEIVQLFMKHCRQQGYVKTSNGLQEEIGVRLEGEKMTELREILVNEGDFKKTGGILVDFIHSKMRIVSINRQRLTFLLVLGGLMDDYLSRQEYKPH